MVRIDDHRACASIADRLALLDNKSLADPTRVKKLRKRIQVNLENYINQHRPLMRGRFGELLLLLPPLQNIARFMVDLVARYNHDTKLVDDLINEMLLSKSRNAHLHRSVTRHERERERVLFSEFVSPFRGSS